MTLAEYPTLQITTPRLPLLDHHEPPFSQEIAQFVADYQPFWHAHMYQPIRKLQFADENPIFDISGEDRTISLWNNNRTFLKGGWNGKIFAECYRLLTKLQILESPHIGLDAFASTTDWMKGHLPEFWPRIQKIIAEKPGFAGPPTQLILPQVPEIAELLVDIGIKAYEQDYGKKPLAFWPPELAVDTDTLDLLSKKGIKFMVLGRGQIESPDEAPIYAVPTKSGESIFVYAYNHELTQTIADSDRLFARSFADYIQSLSGQNAVSVMASNDIETLGHHKGPDSLRFARYFYQTELPKRIAACQLNFQRTLEMVRPGQLKDNITSWSCEHGGERWVGGCNCGGATDYDNKRKRELHDSLKSELAQTLEILEITTGWEGEFIDWYLTERVNIASGFPVSVELVRPEFRHQFKRLLIEIMGLQSCAYYFNTDYERGMAQDCLTYLQTQKIQHS